MEQGDQKLVELLIFLSFLSYSIGERQTVTLYESLDSKGASHTTKTDVSRLSIFNFDNRAQSACVSAGIWIFYEHEDYNRGQSGYVQWRWGEQECFNLDLVKSHLSSVRHAGPLSNFRGNSLTLYKSNFFSGDSYYVVGERKNFQREAASLILTGNLPWTLYTDENFRGKPTCVYPGVDGAPSFIPDISRIGLTKTSVRSFRPGCWTTRR